MYFWLKVFLVVKSQIRLHRSSCYYRSITVITSTFPDDKDGRLCDWTINLLKVMKIIKPGAKQNMYMLSAKENQNELTILLKYPVCCILQQ